MLKVSLKCQAFSSKSEIPSKSKTINQTQVQPEQAQVHVKQSQVQQK